MTGHNSVTRISNGKMTPMLLLLLLVSSTVTAIESNNNNDFVSLKLTPRHVAEDRRRRELRPAELEDKEPQSRRREDALQVGALFEGYGTHYVDLWCGSPPQRQTVIVDTGSGVTAFPCSGCRDCGAPDYHINPLFVEADSSTYQESTCSNTNDCLMKRSNCRGTDCRISMSYAEGSRWDAVEVVDRCYIAGPHETPLVAADPNKAPLQVEDDLNPNHAADLAFDMTFGCQNLVTGLFKTQLADGIMGMSNQDSTYWSQMFNADKMGTRRIFGLCYSRPDLITSEGTEAGAMTLGGVDERLHSTQMVYTSNFNNGRPTFFSVKVRRMMLREGKFGVSAKSTGKNPNEGVRILNVSEKALNTGGIIVDSGTTDTYWNTAIGNEFKAVFKEMSGMAFDNNPHSMSMEEILALPTILIQLQSDAIANIGIKKPYEVPGLAGAMDTDHPYDVILAIPPTHYMEYQSEKDQWTSRFYPTERGGSVLGANAMMGHDISFDIEKTRIGWAESDCDYTSMVTGAGYSFDIDGTMKDVEIVDNTDSRNDQDQDGDSKSCEGIRSGTTCDRTEGCKWNWGKCKARGDATEEEEAAATTAPTDVVTDVATEEASQGATLNPNAAAAADLAANIVTTAQDNAMEIGIAVGVSALVCLFFGCIFCLCCGRGPKKSRSRSKRSRGGTGPTIELTTNGFHDEPEDDDDDNDDGSESGSSTEGESRSRSSSKRSATFRDDPSKPEFDGDYL